MQTRFAILALTLASTALLAGCSAVRYQPSTDYHATYQQPAENSKHAQRKHQRAIAALELDDLAKAEVLCKEVLVADKRFGAAHNTLGTIYFQQGQFYQAAWEFEYARQKLPNRPEPHNNLGMVFERTQNYENALYHYQQAISIEPQNPEYLGNLVRLKIKLGDRSSQVQQELRALLEIEHRPEWARWTRDQLALKEFCDPYDPAYMEFEQIVPGQPALLAPEGYPTIGESEIFGESELDGLLDQVPRTTPDTGTPLQPVLPVYDSFGDVNDEPLPVPNK